MAAWPVASGPRVTSDEVCTDWQGGRKVLRKQTVSAGGGGVTRHSAQQVGPSLDWIQMLALLLTGHMGIFLDLSGPCSLLKGGDIVT